MSKIRLAVSKKFHPKYIYYTKAEKSSDKKLLFSTMGDLFVLSAIYGFYLDNFKPISESDESVERVIPWDVFDEPHLQIIKSICLLHDKDNPKNANILLDAKKMSEIVEGYANGGFQHLINKIEGVSSIDIEGNLLAAIVEEYEK